MSLYLAVSLKPTKTELMQQRVKSFENLFGGKFLNILLNSSCFGSFTIEEMSLSFNRISGGELFYSSVYCFWKYAKTNNKDYNKL